MNKEQKKMVWKNSNANSSLSATHLNNYFKYKHWMLIITANNDEKSFSLFKEQTFRSNQLN